MKKLIPLLALAAAIIPAKASVIVTYAENPEANLSSLSGTQVFNFDSLKTGVNKNVAWGGVGSFDQLYVKGADSYGGAADATNPNGTKYSLQGAGTAVLNSTLLLDTPSSYFGMWWSAGDSKNVLDFYRGDTLVSTFNTASLMEPLPGSYDGNPRNRAINGGEPYAFINFFGDENTAWDRVVLRNNGSSGFESDNYTTRAAAWNPATDGALPGVAVSVVTGTTTTAATPALLEGTRWTLDETSVGNAPGAPLPPWTMLLAFAAVVAARKGKKAKASV
ncbi:MAG: hypothetical protein JWL81_702 [Verrucomicrobiales bacterium]|nr:hypothetical protein [Verrucomicrobiales bacterium]